MADKKKVVLEEEKEVKITKIFELKEGITKTEITSVEACTRPLNGERFGFFCVRDRQLARIDFKKQCIEETLKTTDALYWIELYRNRGEVVDPPTLVAAHPSGKISVFNAMNLNESPQSFTVGTNNIWRVIIVDDGEVDTMRIVTGSWSQGEIVVCEFNAKNIPTVKLLEKKMIAKGEGFVSSFCQSKVNPELVLAGFYNPHQVMIINWKEKKVVKKFVQSDSCIRALRTYVCPTMKEERIVGGNESKKIFVTDMQGNKIQDIMMPHYVHSLFYFSSKLMIYGGVSTLGCLKPSVNDFKVSVTQTDTGTIASMRWVDRKKGIIMTSSKQQTVYFYKLEGIENYIDRELEKDMIERLEFLKEREEYLDFSLKMFDKEIRTSKTYFSL